MSDPIGFVVACRTSAGHWIMDSIGMHPTREEAAEDKADAEADDALSEDTGDRYFVCAVIPAGDDE